MIRDAERLHTRFALALASLCVTTAAHADWYSAATAWPQDAENNSFALPNDVLAMTFDNFTWVPGSGVIDRVGGHFHALGTSSAGATYDPAYWEIRMRANRRSR